MTALALIRELQKLPPNARLCIMDDNRISAVREGFAAHLADAIFPTEVYCLQVDTDAPEIELEP